MAHHGVLFKSVQGSVRLSFLDAPKWAVILYIIFLIFSNIQSAARMPVQAPL